MWKATFLFISSLLLLVSVWFIRPPAPEDFPEPLPAQLPAKYEADPEPLEDAENELIERALLENANVIEDCTVTYYDCCRQCCGNDTGITASGLRASPGVTCAVDPHVIPLGSDVLVDYGDGDLHYLRADDTGGGVSGAHIDICVETHEEAVALGVKTATVYWIDGVS